MPFNRILKNIKETFLLIIVCLLLSILSIVLWQKIRMLKSTQVGSHSHRHVIFQPLTVVQQDSILKKYYGNNVKFERVKWSDIPVYLVIDIKDGNAKKMVAFIEEDVSCPTCQDVHFLIELNSLNEIVNIHFIKPFESFAGLISQKRMNKYKQQFLGRNVMDSFDKYDAITGATKSSHHFFLGLQHLKQVLMQKTLSIL